MNRYPAKVLFGKKFPEMPQQLPDGENIVPFPKGHFFTKIEPSDCEEDILQFYLKSLFCATFIWEIKDISRHLFIRRS
jgi:hypothetical protein